jgi:RNA polymerase sigma-70 factor (ECF subfamily)
LRSRGRGRRERGAVDILLARHVDRVHAVCRRILGNDQDALDATQEALIAIVRGIASFDGRAQFATWCYRVATNAALDESRRRQRRPRPVDVVPEAVSTEPATDARVADVLDVDAALATLPEEFRVAVARPRAGLRRDRTVPTSPRHRWSHRTGRACGCAREP